MVILQSNIQATTISGTLPVAWSSSTSCPELLFHHTPHWPSSQAPQFCCPPPAEDQPHRGHLLRWRHSSHGLQAGEQRSQSPSSVAGMVYSSFYLLGKKKQSSWLLAEILMFKTKSLFIGRQLWYQFQIHR